MLPSISRTHMVFPAIYVSIKGHFYTDPENMDLHANEGNGYCSGLLSLPLFEGEREICVI